MKEPITAEYGIIARPTKEHEVYTWLHHLREVGITSVVPNHETRDEYHINVTVSSIDLQGLRNLEDIIRHNRNIKRLDKFGVKQAFFYVSSIPNHESEVYDALRDCENVVEACVLDECEKGHDFLVKAEGPNINAVRDAIRNAPYIMEIQLIGTVLNSLKRTKKG